MAALDVKSLAARLTTIESLAYLPKVTSTNAIARRVMSECVQNEIPIPEAMIIALEQTDGRGRGSRSWTSPPEKGIWSTAMHAVPTDRLAWLPLRVATIVASFLREAFDAPAQIKWPNDILVDGKKIAGILIEARNQTDVTFVIIGTGLNVLPSDEFPDTAAVLADVSKRDHVELTTSTIAFVEYFDRELGRDVPPIEVVEKWRSLSVHESGDRISCTLGNTQIDGTWIDIDDEGRALIRRGDETIPISAGDLISRD